MLVFVLSYFLIIYQALVTGTTNLNDKSYQQVVFTPFLVNSANLISYDSSNYFQLQSDMLSLTPDPESVSELEELYKTYYPREAKVTPFNIVRTMTVTWDLTTGPPDSVKVSRSVRQRGQYNP